MANPYGIFKKLKFRFLVEKKIKGLYVHYMVRLGMSIIQPLMHAFFYILKK